MVSLALQKVFFEATKENQASVVLLMCLKQDTQGTEFSKLFLLSYLSIYDILCEAYWELYEDPYPPNYFQRPFKMLQLMSFSR